MITAICILSNRRRYQVTFDLGVFDQTGRRMIVAGSFNNWAIRIPNARSGFVDLVSEHQTVAMELLPGTYEYKYYDMAHAEWMEVARYPEIYRGYHWDYTANPFGTLNCIIRLPAITL